MKAPALLVSVFAIGGGAALTTGCDKNLGAIAQQLDAMKPERAAATVAFGTKKTDPATTPVAFPTPTGFPTPSTHATTTRAPKLEAAPKLQREAGPKLQRVDWRSEADAALKQLGEEFDLGDLQDLQALADLISQGADASDVDGEDASDVGRDAEPTGTIDERVEIGGLVARIRGSFEIEIYDGGAQAPGFELQLPSGDDDDNGTVEGFDDSLVPEGTGDDDVAPDFDDEGADTEL